MYGAGSKGHGSPSWGTRELWKGLEGVWAECPQNLLQQDSGYYHGNMWQGMRKKRAYLYH